MATAPSSSLSHSQPPFKDFHPGLIIFGIVQVLIAAAMFLLAILIWMVPAAAAKQAQAQGGPPFPIAALSLIYVVPGIGFAALGIGSMLRKNWARVLTIAVSFLWLALGILTMVMTAFFVPAILKMQSATPRPQNVEAIMPIVLGILGVFGVVFPVAFLAFYLNRNVKGTCLRGETSPLTASRPVLMNVLIVWFGFCLLSLPFSLSMRYPRVFFGMILFGWAGKALYLVLALLPLAVAVWGYIRRNILGWWSALFYSTFWPISAAVTFLRIDIFELYRKMGMNEQQLLFLHNRSFVTAIVSFTVVLMVLALAGVIYSRRYFNSDAEATVAPSPA